MASWTGRWTSGAAATSSTVYPPATSRAGAASWPRQGPANRPMATKVVTMLRLGMGGLDGWRGIHYLTAIRRNLVRGLDARHPMHAIRSRIDNGNPWHNPTMAMNKFTTLLRRL